MSFIDAFDCWITNKGDFHSKDVDSTSEGTVTTWPLTQASVDFGFYVEKSIQTNVNEKFIDNKTGTLVCRFRDLTFTPKIDHKLIYNSEDYFIIGTDNVGLQNEVWLLKFRKENG